MYALEQMGEMANWAKVKDSYVKNCPAKIVKFNKKRVSLLTEAKIVESMWKGKK